jgi:hypothetical protein
MKKLKYFELPIAQFLRLYPQFADILPPPVLSDPRYIVRFNPDSELLEVGFSEDVWAIS